MLIRFEVENYRSIHESVELSMVAVDDRPEARSHPRIGVSLVPTAGVFGPNASGKSNVLRALAWLRTAVAYSLRLWDDQIPVEPFAFSTSPQRDTSFTVEHEVDGVRFEYLLDVGRDRVSYEALFHYPEGKRRRIFERDGSELTLQRGLGSLSGVRPQLSERSLALSIMRRFDEPLTSGFARQLLNMQILGQPLSGFRSPGAGSQTISMFDARTDGMLFYPEDLLTLADVDAGGTREQALALLRLADLGVVDVEILETIAPSATGTERKRRSAQLIHQGGQQQVPFKFRDESAGTRTWFDLIGPLLNGLRQGALVVFDELDASLHPTLTSQVIRLFESPTSNPHGAQLVFTSHDTNLLNHLNRDEVWLTQKQDSGGTRFAALSGFAGERVRRSANLEAGYLSGRFGALPDVSDPELLRTLGLIG